MNNDLANFEDLQKFSGKDKPSEVAAWLAYNKIPFFKGKHNRPCTTNAAINSALGLNQVTYSSYSEDQEIEVG